MIFSGSSPVWFLGFDAIFALVFILVTATIALYSWRVYRLSGHRRFLWWGVGFASICAGYAVDAFSNYYLYARIVRAVAQPVPAAIDIQWMHIIGHLANVGFFVAGFLLLVLVALRFDDLRLITLFGSIVGLLSLAIVASHRQFLFQATLLFLIGHIIFYTVANWKRERVSNKLRPWVILGFVGLFLGQAAYLFMPLWPFLYVAGHFLELIGYGLLAGSMAVIMRR